MRIDRVVPVVLLLLAPATDIVGQSVLTDEGSFTITMAGRAAGTETFSVRRAGIGPEAAFFGSGSVTVHVDGVTHEIRPLLRTGPDGGAVSYQVNLAGPATLEILLTRAGPRYTARITSPAGQEVREFRARDDTRVIDVHVAHHYYFLRDLPAGASLRLIEPSRRTEIEATVTAIDDVVLPVGSMEVSARRMTIRTPAGERSVWFDQQGRVLRVEIPSDGYAAQRDDLVG